MMVEASPKAPFEMIEPQIILRALVVLFDVPAGAAQFQALSFRRRPVQVSEIVVIRFGIAPRPVHHEPDFFQFAPGAAQHMLQKYRSLRAERLAIRELDPQAHGRVERFFGTTHDQLV